MRDQFINAILSKRKVRVTFHSKEDGHELTRLCAPMDYGPSRKAHDKSDRFHMWEYESDKRNHTLSLLPDQIRNIEFLTDSFDPAEFVTWQPDWIVKRDWGQYS